MNDTILSMPELEAYEPFAGTGRFVVEDTPQTRAFLREVRENPGMLKPGKIVPLPEGVSAADVHSIARAHVSPPTFDLEKINTVAPDPLARDGAQTSTIKPETRASAGSGVAPSDGVIASIILSLPYPISANRYWASRTVTPRGGKSFTTTYVTPEAKAYKAQVQKLALVAGVRKPIAGRVKVEFILYPNRPQDWQKRMRKDGAAWDDSVMCLDLDNAQKVVLDSLKDVVFQDDAWVREIHARRAEPDEFGARLLVVVTPLMTYDPQTDLFGAGRAA